MSDNKNKIINANKLKFKTEFEEAGRITVRAGNGHMYPMGKEAIIKTVGLGYHQDRIDDWFTEASIKDAMKPEAKSKSKTDEGKN